MPKPMLWTVVAKGYSEHNIDSLRLREWITDAEQLGRAIMLDVGQSCQATTSDGTQIGVVRTA